MLSGGTTIIDGVAIEQILREELGTLKAAIIVNIRKAGEWASGQTAASMQVTANGGVGILAGRRAFYTLEMGRRAGKVPRNMQTIIYDWMQAKGVHGTAIPYVRKGKHKYTPQQRGDMSMAWHISQKIKKEGTRLYRQGGRTDVYTSAIPGAVQRVNTRLAGLMQAKIAEKLITITKEAK